MLRVYELAAQIRAAGTSGETLVDRFLASNSMPLVDEDGVVFLFRDRDAKSSSVHLVHEITGLESRQEFERLGDSSLFFLPMQIPPEARLEYRIEVSRSGQVMSLLDPLNSKRSDCPYGHKSVVAGRAYQEPEFARRRHGVRRGRIMDMEIDSRIFGEKRRIQVYVPARYKAERQYPLLVVHDGADYVRYSCLDVVLDNLMHKREMSDLIAVLTDSPDRLSEYKVDPRQGDFLVEEVLPAMESRFSLERDRSARALMGASYGGLTSLHTLTRYPDVFGLLLSQSGSFLHADVRRRGGDAGALTDSADDVGPILRFVEDFCRREHSRKFRFFLSCGRFEPLIFFNRSLLNVLKRGGFDHRYEESFDGHNWTSWRDHLAGGLCHLFPGEVLFYYP